MNEWVSAVPVYWSMISRQWGGVGLNVGSVPRKCKCVCVCVKRGFEEGGILILNDDSRAL